MARRRSDLQGVEVGSQNPETGDTPLTPLPDTQPIATEGNKQMVSGFEGVIKDGKVSVDAVIFGRIIHAVCMGSPQAVVRQTGIRLLGEMFGVPYEKHEEFWCGLRDWYLAKQ